MPNISVIIPVYNSEKTIERCARHLFEQTLRDIEFIFIDDRSDDKSVHLLENILSEYPERSHQTTIICHSENAGVAKVREEGTKMAIGDYIIHCDSDDWPERNMYEKMYDAAIIGGYDLVISSYFFEINAKRVVWIQDYSDKDPIEALLHNELSSGLWNKLVKRELITDTFVFPNNDMCEDFLYTTQFLMNSKSTYFLPVPLYHFSYNPKSITHDRAIDAVLLRHKQIVVNVTESIDLLHQAYGTKYNDDIIRQCLFVKNGLKRYTNRSDLYKVWKNTFSDINIKVLFSRKVPFKEKVIYILVYTRLYNLYVKYK